MLFPYKDVQVSSKDRCHLSNPKKVNGVWDVSLEPVVIKAFFLSRVAVLALQQYLYLQESMISKGMFH